MPDKTCQAKPTIDELEEILNGPPRKIEMHPDGTVADLTFRQDLEQTINRHSMENGCNTPDFILAKYLHSCLAAFDEAVKSREAWYAPEPNETRQL
jgi:hypothetical protein